MTTQPPDDHLPSSERRRGRPPKLTPETGARILSAIRCGASKKTAAEAAGVAASTLSLWLRLAKEKGAPPEHRDFARRLERAKQEGIVARLATVQKASQSDWRAATWLLERDCPDEYSLKHRVEHSGEMTLAEALADVRRRRDEEHRRQSIEGPAASDDDDASEDSEENDSW